MADAHTLHTSLLKPAILHILRASGFHSTRPSVLDTLTDLCARHLLLLGQATAASIYSRTARDPDPATAPPTTLLTEFTPPPHPAIQTATDPQAPTLRDIRHALDTAAVCAQTQTASEESWREALRRPLASYPAGPARDKERQRRDAADTRDVREFVAWCMGAHCREIRRIAGMQAEVGVSTGAPTAALDGSDAVGGEAVLLPLVLPLPGGEVRDAGVGLQTGLVDGVVGGDVLGAGDAGVRVVKDDYVAVLKKKHSKAGDGARYAGTALGKAMDERGLVRIEGGPETLSAWAAGVKRKVVEVEGEA